MVEIWDSSKYNNSRNQFTPVNRHCTKQFIKVQAVSWTNKDRQTQTKIETGNLLNFFPSNHSVGRLSMWPVKDVGLCNGFHFRELLKTPLRLRVLANDGKFSILKNSNSKRNSGNQGRDFKCEFCQVFLNSQKQLDQHNSSPKHIMTKNSVSKLLNPPVPGYPSMPQTNYSGMAVHGQATKRPKFTSNAPR